MSTKEKIYACIDLKSFYASVECVERNLDPLTARLVVADESRTDKTICLAVSPALKAYGIPGRARLFEVKQTIASIESVTGEKIPFIIAVPRMQKYMNYSAKIFEIYMQFISTDDIVIYSIDEVFIDLTDYLSYYHMSVHELVAAMIKAVKNKTGITATGGIGTNLYLAKIAMDIVAKHVDADADGVRIAELNEESYKEKLWDHKPITDFWRIGRGSAKKLADHGLFTMGDIARMSLQDEEFFYKMFGIDGELVIDHAWGIEPCTIKDIKNYKPDTNSLSSGQVLSRPYSFEETRIVVREMTEDMVLDMVSKKKAAKSIGLYIGYDRISVDNGSYRGKMHIDHYGRKVPPSANGSSSFENHTSSTKQIVSAMETLFNKIVDPKLPVRRITVTANDLIDESKVVHQYSLFEDTEELEKERNLQEALLKLKDRFGSNSVLKGMDMLDGATRAERNNQIGGHKA